MRWTVTGVRILAHRGCLTSERQGNTRSSWLECFASGFGIEVDLRDHNGSLVLSHDPAAGSEPATLTQLFTDWSDAGAMHPVGINIKSSGLGSLITATLGHLPAQWFLFDHAVPDLVAQQRMGLRCYPRLSELETDYATGVPGLWVDSFNGTYPEVAELASLVGDGVNIVLVSPELHGRPHQMLWDSWSQLAENPFVSICTDFAVAADDFFNGHGAR